MEHWGVACNMEGVEHGTYLRSCRVKVQRFHPADVGLLVHLVGRYPSTVGLCQRQKRAP